MSSPESTRVGAGWNELRIATAFRHVGLIGVAALITGLLVGGIGGRIFMRLSAMIAPESAVGALTENGAVVGEITFGGSLALILFIGVFAGGIGAVIYTISELWLEWAGPLRGVVFSVFLLAVSSIAVLDPGNFDFAILGRDPRNVAMLVVLFLAFGPVLVGLLAVLDRRLPAVDPARPIDSIPGYIALVVGGALFLAAMLGNLFIESVCECDPPRLMGVFVLGMLFSTAAWWLPRLRDPQRTPSRYVMILGYATTGGAFATGAARAIADIQHLL